MIQQIILILVFVAAVFYLGRMIFKSFQTKKAHTPGCAKCSAAQAEK
jgi:hypothetical protein